MLVNIFIAQGEFIVVPLVFQVDFRYVLPASLKLMTILLPQPPACWSYRYALSSLALCPFKVPFSPTVGTNDLLSSPQLKFSLLNSCISGIFQCLVQFDLASCSV